VARRLCGSGGRLHGTSGEKEEEITLNLIFEIQKSRPPNFNGGRDFVFMGNKFVQWHLSPQEKR
jgi:hypothetical protein